MNTRLEPLFPKQEKNQTRNNKALKTFEIQAHGSKNQNRNESKATIQPLVRNQEINTP